MGNLCLAVTYLSSPSFQLDELESLLSSGFLSQDEGRDFTPTLIKNKQRDSLSSSPGSLPTRTSLPLSPPMSITDRFVLSPAVNTRTSSFSTFGSGSPRTQNIAFPMGRRPSITGPGTSATAGSTSGVSDASSSRQGASIGSRDDGSALARLRRESFGGLHSNVGYVSSHILKCSHDCHRNYLPAQVLYPYAVLHLTKSTLSSHLRYLRARLL